MHDIALGSSLYGVGVFIYSRVTFLVAEGQAGQGERAETNWVKPRSIKPLQGHMITQVVCGKFHTLCVSATSQVWSKPAPFWSAKSALRWEATKVEDSVPQNCFLSMGDTTLLGSRGV